MHPPHAFAPNWLAEGGNENELMLVAGWKSRMMIDRCQGHGRRASPRHSCAPLPHRSLGTLGRGVARGCRRLVC